MAAPSLAFFLRGSDGLRLLGGRGESLAEPIEGPSDFTAPQKCALFSADGALLAASDGSKVTVWDMASRAVARTISQPGVLQLAFSPRRSFVLTWERFAGTGGDGSSAPRDNVNVWSLATGERVHGYVSRRSEDWEPQWTPDEGVMLRTGTNEVHAYDPKNFARGVVSRLEVAGVAKLAVSPGAAPHKAAIFVPGVKGAPATVRVYSIAGLSQGAPLATKAFYKADKVALSWNPAGTALLVFAQTDVDTSGKSYYGETCLYYMRAGGDYDANIQLGKEGPIYDFAWSPDSKDFVVVYGYMPAKATLFDHTCKPVFDFGTGSRNTVQYNPHGNVIMLGGFGNLRGEMEFWDRRKLAVFARCQASDSTMTQWCPDGVHMLTCTTSPRLRVGNGFKIWRFGELVASGQCAELWEAKWQPQTLTAPVVPAAAAKASSLPEHTAPKPAAYRPPHLRGTDAPQQPTIKLHEHEAPKRLDAPQSQEPMSKAALKNKKKRENRAQKTDETEDKSAAAPSFTPSPSPAVQAPAAPVASDPEVAKKIKTIVKKLKQIELLREEKNAGKALELNQLQKLESEAALRAELAQLERS